ncbi:MAG: hypothetical protein ABS43_03730 [Bordetella sp. SCN 67-23]|nr:hypothetical protein [Burkholderiales bacterium]ODS75911.1 MAG: hypothetical protein ABS43_03730 [Bordetella sp. SCN 67-23]OJW91787.1 MAG: hypothetical protein BGO71_21760 [Burkholderiales bacterium 67-32]
MDKATAVQILQLVDYPGYHFQISESVDGHMWLQARFIAPCNETGQVSEQRTRKWKLSTFMTRSELVQTAFKCVLTSVEHETREQFRYRGQAIFGPHFDVEALAELCLACAVDTRGTA